MNNNTLSSLTLKCRRNRSHLHRKFDTVIYPGNHNVENQQASDCSISTLTENKSGNLLVLGPKKYEKFTHRNLPQTVCQNSSAQCDFLGLNGISIWLCGLYGSVKCNRTSCCFPVAWILLWCLELRSQSLCGLPWNKCPSMPSLLPLYSSPAAIFLPLFLQHKPSLVHSTYASSSP